ncbi:hypothetical protein [Chryseobacterium sp. CP-77]|uniref:hypothetical protein n=1 Tax=Chryseobacterium sp. CP-77 TaxID=3116594 RepID=UPI002ED34261
MDITKIKLENRKDFILYFLIAFSTFLIVYIMFYIIDFYSHNNILSKTPTNINRSQDKLAPNELGDTIGGILNPIIAFCASILTFLAFYIQYKANKEQRAIYNKNLLKEKQEKDDNHHVNLEIFKTLILSTVDHYEICNAAIIDYCENEKTDPLSVHTLGLTPSSSYSIFKSLDFKDMYSSIVFNFRESDYAWEREFIEVLNTIDFFEHTLTQLSSDINSYNTRKENKFNQILIHISEEVEKLFTDPQLNHSKILENYTAIFNNNNRHFAPDRQFTNPDLHLLYDNLLPFVMESLSVSKHDINKFSYQKILKNLEHQYIMLDTAKILAENFASDLEKKANENFELSKNFTEVRIFLDKIYNRLREVSNHSDSKLYIKK